MKKIIRVILLLCSVLSFLILFNEAKINSMDNIRDEGRTLSNTYKVLMPGEVTNKDQYDIYKAIKETADKYKANIFYSRVGMSNDGKNIENDEKYIYLNDTSYFEHLNIYSGRRFNLEENEGNLFVSTQKTNDEKQVGRIASLDKEYNLSVYTLRSLVEKSHLLDGVFYVQLNDDEKIEDFINDLQIKASITKINVVEKENYEDYTSSIKWVAIISLYLLVMFLILYDVLKTYKNTAIKKMLGYSNVTIYFSSVGTLLLIQIIIQIITTIVFGVIKLNAFNYEVWVFLKELFIIYSIEGLILIIFVSIPYLYLNKVKIANMIKNKQPTKEILAFNTAMKCILLIGFFIILKASVEDFSKFSNLYSESFKSWEQTKEYAIIPTIKNSEDAFTIKENEAKFFVDCKELYNYFNDRGAILADFTSFMENSRDFLLNESKGVYDSDNVRVNPNYLKVNPVYDTNGNEVSISEDNSNTVLLIPEKYKNYEDEIVELHKFQDKGAGRDGSKVEIIWIKSGQRLFSYNLEVNSKDGNYITDPFINVMTESNIDNMYYMSVMGYSGNPFKIKIDNSKSVEENILPIVNQYGYSVEVIRVSDTVASEIKAVKDKMKLFMANCALITIMLVILIAQNVYSFFNQYKKYLAVRYLQGYGVLFNYKEYIAIIVLSWLVISTAIRAFNIMTIALQIKVSAVLILLELLISVFFVFKTNRKNIINVVKGS